MQSFPRTSRVCWCLWVSQDRGDTINLTLSLYLSSFGWIADQLIVKSLLLLSFFLAVLVCFRLWRSFGHIFENIIYKTKRIRERFCLMRNWRRSSMWIPLICSKWIKLWPSISGHWILRVPILPTLSFMCTSFEPVQYQCFPSPRI